MDLLVGLWAEQHLPRLDEGQLHEFAAVLDEENPDLFKWLTQQQEPPAHLQHNSIYRSVAQSIAQQLAEKSKDNSRAVDGKSWVRGWDDSWRG
eukprot:jgi/Astpho2/1584/gw1.00028.68.1_t